jgi:phosphonate transport system permease protein
MNERTTSLKDTALGDLAGLRARHPSLMQANWRARALTVLTVAALAAAAVGSVMALDVSWSRVFGGFGKLGEIVGLMLPPDYGTLARLTMWGHALAETVAIAFLGTLAAAALALPFGFLAARNVVPSWIFRFSIRRGLDSVRGVDTLIWALIWINVVGLGPFAGVLAIMTSDFGTFGKMFSEAIEAADEKDGEGVTSTGGGRLHRVRFGLLPQVLPVLLSQVLYLFESNTRSATIIGIVGAGGIGLHLSEQIRTLEWQHVSFLILMILVTVAIVDAISSRLRFAIIGGRAAPTL